MYPNSPLFSITDTTLFFNHFNLQPINKYGIFIGANVTPTFSKQMTSELIELAPKVINDIEFYVSADESTTGLSMIGLSRLCGVDRTTIRELLNLLDDPGDKKVPEFLKTLVGKVFTLGAKGVNGAKIVDSKAASRVIRYYAYESRQAKNDIAKHSYDKFAEIGMEKWIKEITGCGNDQTKVVNLLNQLIAKVDNLEQISVAYHKVRNQTSIVFPNLDKMLDDLEVEDVAFLPSGDYVSINQWLRTKGVSLDRGSKHRFALLVSETYKTTTGKKPRKKMIKVEKGRYQPNTCVYTPEEFPILEMSLRKLLGIN